MNINELIVRAHENAVRKGFYDCPECLGTGEKCKNRYGVIYCGEYESIEETKK
jgi:hypothetical protein